MIEFRALIHAIHKSVRDAAKAVEGETNDFIDRFFERDHAAKHINPDSNEPVLKPKTCTVEFPSRTPDGLEVVQAQVPLITLTPISAPKIEEVKFTTDLEITVDDNDKLLVAFPGPKKPSFFSRDEIRETSNARIEITLTGGEPPEGLKKLIEGYERALRAQIPG